MMSNNKILTVSYGTFSCTLEGFEDSFDTMKAIAEYFRDLAQDDRYFGAEPPQPDADMLARIAEREIARRVDAKADDAGIHLRASTAATAAIASASQTEDPAPVSDDSAAIAPVQARIETPVEDTVADSAAVETPDVEETPVEIDPVETDTTDTAILSVLDDNVSQLDEVATEDVATEDVATEDETQFDDISDAVSEAIADVADSDVAVEDVTADDVTADEDIALEVAEFVDDLDEAGAEDAPVAAPAATSIAAKLQRIRAVVAKNRSSGDGYSEDQHAEEFSATSDDDDGIAPETKAEDTTSDDAFDLVHAGPDTYALEDDAAYEDDALTDTTADAEFEDEEDTEDALSALISRLDEEDVAPAPQEPVLAADDEDDFDDEEAPAFDVEDFANLNLDDDVADAPVEAPEPAERPRGRVVSVKREDLEAAIESGSFEDYAEIDEPEIEENAFDDSSLSESEEDELLAALAEVEAELPDDVSVDDFEDDDDALDGEEENVLGTHILEEATEGEEAELDRLMAEADSQMQEPESSSRRSAFSHLRAAVAATKADDKLSEEANSTEDDGDYRTDLAAAVKPRRPVPAEADTAGERPRTARPAPLKLVAEQRIDPNPVPSETPVQPRRVETADVGLDADISGSFAEYASDQGAVQLSDLLEAAASYLSFVEGREQFSRPQLMTKVRQVGAEGFTREDGLRTFGQLLRTGKIEKVKGGRFTVSEDIGFQPDQRAAG